MNLYKGEQMSIYMSFMVSVLLPYFINMED